MKKFYFLSAFLLIMSLKAFAQPAGWNYSTPYQITENSGSLVLGYQAKLTINTASLIGAGQMLATGDDIRFGKDCSGSTLYNYWIESGINTASTIIWVKIDSLYANSTRTFYMFYGNSSAAAVSAIPLVFNGPMSATDSTANTNLSGSADAQRGFRFSPTEDILVTAFGKSEPSSNPRYITLFDNATQAILSQQQVSGPSAQWSYQNISSPLWLNQSQQYLLEIFFPSGDDAYYFGASPTMGQQITYYDMRYCNGCSQNTFPTNSLGGMLYGYVDMWYWTKNNVSPAPTVAAGTPLTYSAGADQAVCSNDSILIGAPATGGNGPYTYSWSPSTGISSPNAGVTYAHPASNTTYTITVADNLGCMTSDTIAINVNAAPVAIAVAQFDTTCPGASNVAYVSGLSSNIDWEPGGINTISFNPAPLTTTTYTVTGTAANGCSGSDTMRITVIPNPVVTVTGNYSFACDNAVSPLTMTATGAINYDWNSGSGSGSTFTDTPSASQTYTVIGTANYGCADTTTYNVTLMPSPTAAATLSNDSVCPGTCVTITGTATGGTAPYTYLWTPPAVTTPSSTVCPTTTTCYTFFITDSNGCSDTTVQCVNVLPAPVITVTGPSGICAGDVGQMTASGATTFGWAPGTNLDTTAGSMVNANPPSTTTYTVTGTSAAGCTDSTTYTLVVNPLPNVTYTSTQNTACVDDGMFTLTGGTPAGGTYSGPGVSGSSFTPTTAGTGAHTITYSYTDLNGCTASATDVITVNACTGIHDVISADGISVYPNPFSSVLTINRVSSGDVTVNIFDAEGRLVKTEKANGTKIEINTAELANGIYSLQLVDATGTKTFRVAKNN